MNTIFNFITQLLYVVGLMQCPSFWYSHRPSWFQYSSLGPFLMCDKLNWKENKNCLIWLFMCMRFPLVCLVLRRHYQFGLRKLVLLTLISVINGVFRLFDQNKFVWRHTDVFVLMRRHTNFSCVFLFRVAVACVT